MQNVDGVVQANSAQKVENLFYIQEAVLVSMEWPLY